MKQSFLVWCPARGSDVDDARVQMAYGSEQAACLWAERDDAASADYTIVGGNPASVIVRDPDGVDHAITVSGESQPYYSARTTIPPTPSATKERT